MGLGGDDCLGAGRAGEDGAVVLDRAARQTRAALSNAAIGRCCRRQVRRRRLSEGSGTHMAKTASQSTKAVETRGKGSVSATNAVETHKATAVSLPHEASGNTRQRQCLHAPGDAVGARALDQRGQRALQVLARHRPCPSQQHFRLTCGSIVRPASGGVRVRWLRLQCSARTVSAVDGLGQEGWLVADLICGLILTVVRVDLHRLADEVLRAMQQRRVSVRVAVVRLAVFASRVLLEDCQRQRRSFSIGDQRVFPHTHTHPHTTHATQRRPCSPPRLVG